MNRISMSVLSAALWIGSSAMGDNSPIDAETFLDTENVEFANQTFDLEQELAALEAELAGESEAQIALLEAPAEIAAVQPEPLKVEEAPVQMEAPAAEVAIAEIAPVKEIQVETALPQAASEMKPVQQEVSTDSISQAPQMNELKIESATPIKAENLSIEEALPTLSNTIEVKELPVEAAPVELPYAKTTIIPIIEKKKSDDASIVAAAPVQEKIAVVEPVTQQLISFNIDFRQVFSGAPIIYTILFMMSICSVFLWLYNILRMRQAVALSPTLLKHVREKLQTNQYDGALSLCNENNSIFCRMIATGVANRRNGVTVVLDTMKAEGKRATLGFWQRLSLLNDVAVIAPMLGLLGTVLGMFYAFYDLNRSLESFSTLFDGLGISVGTTVAGLIVSIISLFLYALGRFRLVKALSRVENEAEALAPLIENRNLNQG